MAPFFGQGGGHGPPICALMKLMKQVVYFIVVETALAMVQTGLAASHHTAFSEHWVRCKEVTATKTRHCGT